MRNEILSRAYNKASHFNLTTDIIDELSDITFCALGIDFFEKPLIGKKSFTRESQTKHPLINLLSDEHTIDLGIIELLEIGLYLKSFSTDRNIMECINNLKHQYNSTLLQLAFSHRFKVCGSDVSLEPKTLRGKSDIFFIYKNSKFIAECYRISRTVIDYIGIFYNNLSGMLFSLVPENKIYSFKLRICDPIDNLEKEQIVKKFKKITPALITDNSCTIKEDHTSNSFLSVEDITNINPDPHFDYNAKDEVIRTGDIDADICLCQKEIITPNIFLTINQKNSCQEKRRNRFLVWDGCIRSSEDKLWSTLRSKLNKKIKQTKTIEKDTGRFIIVEIPFDLTAITDNMNKLLEFQHLILNKFENIAGMMVVERRANNSSRFEYRGPILAGKPKNTIHIELVQKINLLEKSDIFKINRI